ncbi:MAG: hypothetical protein M3273_06505 [Actinomycetota bacterium]|nr:hypothetical protein [Actinomycetota bacterium]
MGRKLRALAGAALIATGMCLAGPVEPASAATSCASVPATTPGFTVGVAGTQHRIPAFSGIAACVSIPDALPVAPVVSNSIGGACTTSCTTISLQVSPVDVGALSVTFTQDGARTTHAVDPEAVGTSTTVCLVSVGTPQAPVPTCTLSLGSDQDLTGTVAGLISQATTLANQKIAEAQTLANQTVAQATTLVNQTVATATTLVNQTVATACNGIPDGPNGQDACTSPASWASAVANQAAGQVTTLVNATVAQATTLVNQTVTTACNGVPKGPNAEDACTNPAGWAAAIAFDALNDAGTEIARQLEPVCSRFGPRPDGTHPCNDAIQWAVSVAEGLDPVELFQEIRCRIDPDTCWQ